MQRRSSLPMIIIISLSGLGLLYVLFNRPETLILTLITGLIVFGIFYMILQLLSGNNKRNTEHSAYKKAVKQSKKRYNERSRNNQVARPMSKSVQSNKAAHPNIQKRKNHPHLTVIEGKKGKKKNRASF
ncbi:SA1362 family protein [Bacillus sp. SM2101]|uniref:SA1362 family protein n=1 Tax=Bacillus sp. SM2101 TaxID=2805366 RepID=UPI001BDE24C0|nr:SA1362 family protein [Bacillus sp. SM2101]